MVLLTIATPEGALFGLPDQRGRAAYLACASAFT